MYKESEKKSYLAFNFTLLGTARYGKVGSWLMQTFSGVFDLILREFNFALAAHVT